MKSSSFFILILFIFTSTGIVCIPAIDSNAEGISFEVIGTKIVEKIVGVNDKKIGWEDNEAAKGIVVTVKAKVPEDMDIWGMDFNLAYSHGDKDDDRTRCSGMTTVVSSADDEGAWVLGAYVHAPAKKGTRYFKLLFGLENDVKRFTLQYSIPVVRRVVVNRD